MNKVFIFWICGECGEPIGIVDVCLELGYNAFGYTNFHGELSLEDTEKLRQDLINALIKDDKADHAVLIEKNTKVFEIKIFI